MTSSTALPPVNPWDVVPSEPVESTGWANFDNFENSLNIENAASEDKKPRDDELKEKVSETIADSKEKDTTSESVGDGNEKESKDSANIEVTGSDMPSNTETNLNSKSDEKKTIFADKNANPSKPPVTSRYL